MSQIASKIDTFSSHVETVDEIEHSPFTQSYRLMGKWDGEETPAFLLAFGETKEQASDLGMDHVAWLERYGRPYGKAKRVGRIWTEFFSPHDHVWRKI